MTYNVLDLFCGIGGFSKGFEMAGYNILAGIDKWDTAIETYKENHPKAKAICMDLTKTPNSFFEQYTNKIDVIIAGIPCQGFTMCGRRKKDDKRNTLFHEVIRAVQIIQPQAILIENVVGLLSMKNQNNTNYKDIIITELQNQGYNVAYKILDASNYHVPQKRKRVFFIATHNKEIQFPKPLQDKITVKNALGNIPDTDKKTYNKPYTSYQKQMAGPQQIYNHKKIKHSPEVITRIKYVPQGGNWKNIPDNIYNVHRKHSNTYRRLDPDQPAITINHARKSMIIHPYYDRVITPREIARIQSIPDSYKISGTKSEQYQQLVNAVPPNLAYHIAITLKKQLKETTL